VHDNAADSLLHYVHKLAVPGEIGRLTDGQLLDRFVQRRDEAAFEVLVHRHGAMVWRVCRQVLRSTQDCEDAYQATFLVLARKARAIGRPELLGNWLYGVAARVAGRLRKTLCRRLAHERPGAESLAEQSADTAGEPELLAELHEALRCLPAKYRWPLVLCYLEGRTNEETARQLNWPLGTLKVRLMRGRDMLRSRLQRRGLAVREGLLVPALPCGASEALSTSVVDRTVTAGLLLSAGKTAAAAALSPRAVALTQGMLEMMCWTKVQTLAAVLVVVALVAASTGWLSLRSTAARHPAAPNGSVLYANAGAPQASEKPAQPAGAAKAPVETRPPPPGGDAPVTKARLNRACVSGNDHTWYFKGKQFILVGDKGMLPASVLQALLGPDRKSSRIFGQWDLDTEKAQLVLKSLVADGKPGPKEVRLGISPAGLLRVNIEKAGQYNVISFADRLPLPGGGVTFPIYDHANKIDHEFLQGTWKVEGHEEDGKALPANRLRGCTIVVKGNTFTTVFQGATSRGTFQLDAVPTPGTLDVTFTQGPEKGRTYRGIYEIKGDTLRFCRARAGKDRPTAFASKAGGGHILSSAGRKESTAR
jgi:RNA polymerase sigma factor (sigma-70 family)